MRDRHGVRRSEQAKRVHRRRRLALCLRCLRSMCNAADERASKTKYRKVKKSKVKKKNKQRLIVCALAARIQCYSKLCADDDALCDQEVDFQLSTYYDHLANSSKLVWALTYPFLAFPRNPTPSDIAFFQCLSHTRYVI